MSFDSVSARRRARRLAVAVALALAAVGLTAQPAAATGLLTVTKSADGFAEKEIVYDWTVEKTVDPGSLELAKGGSGDLTYWIDATRTKVSETTVYGVRGEICVTNDSPLTTVGLVVEDTVGANLGGGNSVLLGTLEITPEEQLDPGETACYPYEIEFEPVAGALSYKNHARAHSQNFTSGFYQTPFTLPEPTVTTIDEAADLTDVAQCPAGFTCEPSSRGPWYLTGSASLHYDVTVTNVSAECGTTHRLPNTATLTEKDTGTERTSDASVTITTPPCAGGCTLTPGYWKTHSIYGPAPYDNTWAQIGEDTTFFLSGRSYYRALWTPPAGNAYYILAHAYIAAKLNFLNGSDPAAAQSAFNSATTLLNTYTPAQIGALSGGNSLRKQFVALADTLDKYNNGLIGPGHCED